MNHVSPMPSNHRELMIGRRQARTLASSRFLTAAALAAVLCLVAAPPAAGQEQSTLRNLPTELIKVTNVSIESAYTLADGVCRGAGMRRTTTADGQTDFAPNCLDVRYLEDERMLAVTATPEVIARVTALLAEFDRLPETRSFHVIVLSATAEGAIAPEIPASARTALEDVSEFLPYSGFSVLGTGWIRTSSEGMTTLAGPEEFIAELAFRPTTDPSASLLIEHFNVYQNKEVAMRVDGNMTTQFRRTGTLQSTFTISPGETVVVGTSKLNGGDSAVVVLLTAVQN